MQDFILSSRAAITAGLFVAAATTPTWTIEAVVGEVEGAVTGAEDAVLIRTVTGTVIAV